MPWMRKWTQDQTTNQNEDQGEGNKKTGVRK